MREGVSDMYAEGTMTREEFRRARREQIHREQQSRRRRILIFLVTIVVMFGMGVGFGTLLAKAEETEKAPAYKYYANIEIQRGIHCGRLRMRIWTRIIIGTGPNISMR